MKRQYRFIIPSLLLVGLCAPLVVAPGCNPSGNESTEVQQALSYSLAEQDTCANVTRVLATSVITREKGKPTEASIPFEVKSGPVPVCVSVTSIEAKPRVLASGRFVLDGEEVLGPSAFNQNTVNASATRDLDAGSHTLTARIASAPGTKVRVYVYEAAKQMDAPVMGSAVVLPDKETVISVAGGTFTFPTGAVDAPVPVTIVPMDPPIGMGTRYELFPDGMQFSVPVPVAIPYDPSKLPPTVTEADLLAVDAIQLLHDGEWRDTNVDALNRMLHGTIEHFCSLEPGSKTAIDDCRPGYTFTTDYTNGVYIAKFPLGQKGYNLFLEAERKPEVKEPADEEKQLAWFRLKPVTSHVDHLNQVEHIAINATPWGALSGNPNDTEHPYSGGNLVDRGGPSTGLLGTGTFSWSAAFTGWSNVKPADTSRQVNNDSPRSDHIMVIGSSHESGLEAHMWDSDGYAAARSTMATIEAQAGGHAVLLGSTIWPVNKFAKPNDTCTLDEVPNEPNTLLAIVGKPGCNGCRRELWVIVSRNHKNLRDQLCTNVLPADTWGAILLDGGNSAAMVHNGNLLDGPKESLIYGTARNVVNAFAIAPAMSISAPTCAAVSQDFDFSAIAAPAEHDHTVTVHCASEGITLKKEGVEGGSTHGFTFNWSSVGEKEINCTTFNKADGTVIAMAKKRVQVGRVDSVAPETEAKLNQETTFVIQGENLCRASTQESTVAFIKDCVGMGPTTTLQTTGTATERKFKCTPAALGSRTGEVKTKSMGFNYLLNGDKTFSVEFVP